MQEFPQIGNSLTFNFQTFSLSFHQGFFTVLSYLRHIVSWISFFQGPFHALLLTALHLKKQSVIIPKSFNFSLITFFDGQVIKVQMEKR